MSEWITFERVAELLDDRMTAPEVAREMNFARSALFVPESQVASFDPSRCTDVVPVRHLPGHSVYYTSVKAIVGKPISATTGSAAHPVSHVWDDAVLPFVAARAVRLLREDARRREKTIRFMAAYGATADVIEQLLNNRDLD